MFDLTAYLKEKAAAKGLVLLAGPAENRDAVIFAIADSGGSSAGLSMSGLELMQNHTDEAMKSLADHRFACAIQTLKDAS